jgi:hypothetical protein
MEFSIELLCFLIGAGFVAAFIDSVVGGGGLISLPALLMMGLPPTMALGTNKMASVMGSCTSTLAFLQSGKIDLFLIKYLFGLSFLGSALGVYTVQQIPSQFLKPLVVGLLLGVTVYTFIKKEWGDKSTYRGINKKVVWSSGVAALGIGFYDGFFGPGAGSLFIFAFLFIGFDFVVSAGNAKALNFASNVAGVVAFAWFNSINYYYAVPMGIAMIVGAIAGSRLAIKKGAAYVKPLFLAVSVVLIGRQLWDLFNR